MILLKFIQAVGLHR